MGMTRECVEIYFYVADSTRERDTKALEDFRAAVGALLQDHQYEEMIAISGGATDAYHAMDEHQRGRVWYMINSALLRVREGRK